MSAARGQSRLSIEAELIEQSIDGMFAFDLEFRLVLWNGAMERIMGLGRTDVLGRNVFALFPFFSETGEDAALRRALGGSPVTSRDRPYSVPGTGRSGYFDARYGPLFSPSGEVVGGSGLIRETTEQKLAEQKMVETETRFKNMADVSPVLLWMSRSDGLCTFFNQSWLAFTGRTMEEEWGVGWAEGIHFEDFQRCMDTYNAAFSERRVFEMEYRLRRKDGEYRWILDRGAPRYAEGRFEGYIGSCVDIMDQKRLEADLRDAVRARDEFLSIAAHELRTPLTALQLQADGVIRSLERGGSEAGLEQARRTAKIAGRQVKRLSDLVEVLLDVSRLSEGRLVLERAEGVSLVEVVESTLARFQTAAESAGSELRFRADTPVTGCWDRLRLEQVTTNLLANAIKYGRGEPIEVSVHGDEDFGELRVTDHGIGIALEDQTRIFDRFARAVPARHYGGFGLGLWIAREIVVAHGGLVNVESTPGVGASFRVVLRRAAG